MHKFLWTALFGMTLAASAIALPRDTQQKAEFRKANACPSTGSTKGACPCYRVDHERALTNGGRTHARESAMARRSQLWQKAAGGFS